ncbi:MAG: hypothetical protein JXM70_07250 [Pirellulales bacterium]|nr:hypothetical protein [Pirellulales bacterium]
MFPDNVSDWPLKIDSTHQLFLDDFLISEIDNLNRQFHQPVKYPGNPLMKGWSVNVLYDSQKEQFRMWKSGEYLTSRDGIHWKQIDLESHDKQSIAAIGKGLWKESLRGVMYNPDIPEREGRYKAVVERKTNPAKNEPGGFYVYHSCDGLRWKLHPEEPVLQPSVNHMRPAEFRSDGAGNKNDFQWEEPDHIQSIGCGDTTTFRYDTVLKRYICDGKFKLHMPRDLMKQLGIVHEEHKPLLRLRTFSESKDLIHWSPPRMMMYPDRLDPPDRQIYSHVGFVYESMWVGIVRAMRLQVTGWKQVELQLSYSRDGRHWSRPRHRPPFIPLGKPDSWEPDYSGVAFTAPILVGEELYFYYFGSRHFTRDRIPVESFQPYVGLAKLRRDGFASLNAGDTPGRVITRPLQFQGNTLYVNSDVADNGWIKGAVLSRDSKPIDGCTIDESTPLTKDTTRGRMTWKSKSELTLPGEKHFRIQFELKNAKLYSFWIE